MAALSITASQVQPGSTAARQSGTAGETITAGQPVYKKASDGKLYKADNATSAATADVKGIALHGASDGQPLDYQPSGDVTLGAGASMTVGEIYVVGTTAGDIEPEGDLVSTEYVTVLGVATSASVLSLAINASGAQVP